MTPYTYFYLLIGPAACGKSTYSSTLKDTCIVSSDAMRKAVIGNEEDQTQNGIVFSLCQSAIYRLLFHGKNVCFDATNLTKSDRKEYINISDKLCEQQGLIIKVIGVSFKTTKEQCFLNNKNRQRHVPEHVIHKHFTRYEKPTMEEGFDEIIEI